MKNEFFTRLGLDFPSVKNAAKQCLYLAVRSGLTQKQATKELRGAVKSPHNFLDHPIFGNMARLLCSQPGSAASTVKVCSGSNASFRQWGENLDPKSVAQMHAACALPVSVCGALMPDAHVGYGLPIGGVLATSNAVIPYAVGVDIACRMKMTALDLPPSLCDKTGSENLRNALEEQTLFGLGTTYRRRREHAVMDLDWNVSPVTAKSKDIAWAQLGTSGSGNHFVEFGVLTVLQEELGLPAGEYLALLSHSGSRRVGAEVCHHYSALARDQRRRLSKEQHHLAWLDLDSHAGQEYWAAMQLMGKYAAANHAVIHRQILKHLGANNLFEVENHHNFAWRETHGGKTLVVHRKGATPAAAGILGIIPGSMATRAYVVRGLGNPESLNSAAHGAGRVMSRSEAKRSLSWDQARPMLQARHVTVLSAGIDEVPMVYKDIEEVMRQQRDLVISLAYFQPRLVKMAPAGEMPED